MSEPKATYQSTPAALPAATPATLLSAERLAEMYSTLDREALWRNEAEETAACYVRDVTDLLAEVKRLTARAETAEARMKEMQMELAEQERAKLLLIQEITARDKGENATIWRITRSITNTFQDYGKKFGGPAVGHDKRFWASIEDEWYDDIKKALWPTRVDD